MVLDWCAVMDSTAQFVDGSFRVNTRDCRALLLERLYFQQINLRRGLHIGKHYRNPRRHQSMGGVHPSCHSVYPVLRSGDQSLCDRQRFRSSLSTRERGTYHSISGKGMLRQSDQLGDCLSRLSNGVGLVRHSEQRHHSYRFYSGGLSLDDPRYFMGKSTHHLRGYEMVGIMVVRHPQSSSG